MTPTLPALLQCGFPLRETLRHSSEHLKFRLNAAHPRFAIVLPYYTNSYLHTLIDFVLFGAVPPSPDPDCIPWGKPVSVLGHLAHPAYSSQQQGLLCAWFAFLKGLTFKLRCAIAICIFVLWPPLTNCEICVVPHAPKLVYLVVLYRYYILVHIL